MAPVLAAPALSFGAKIAIALALSVSLFAGGAFLGYKYASNACKARVVDRIVRQTKYLPQETKIIHDQVVTIKTVHDKVYVNVPKLIPDNRVCDVPAAGVGMLNSNRALPSGK